MVDNSLAGLLQLAKRFNNFHLAECRATWLPFVCENHQVGLVSPAVLRVLRHEDQDVFRVDKHQVVFADALDTYEKRSRALDRYLRAQRQQLESASSSSFSSLAGWREENYEVASSRSASPLFQVERAATPILGLRQYGVHINGMVEDRSTTSLWLQVRSRSKQTYPGMLDSFVGGGLAVGRGVRETALKELEEEAGLRLQQESDLRSAGSVSFFHKSERGLHPQTEFVFDLRLPPDFRPVNRDGEVEDWRLVPATQLLSLLRSQEYKTTSIPVALDWLVRHGYLSAEKEHDLPALVEQLHMPIHTLYA